MIILRCANGVVLYYYTPIRPDRTFDAICLSDGVKFTITVEVKGQTGAQLASLITHAVSIAGAFQQIAILPLETLR